MGQGRKTNVQVSGPLVLVFIYVFWKTIMIVEYIIHNKEGSIQKFSSFFYRNFKATSVELGPGKRRINENLCDSGISGLQRSVNDAKLLDIKHRPSYY